MLFRRIWCLTRDSVIRIDSSSALLINPGKSMNAKSHTSLPETSTQTTFGLTVRCKVGSSVTLRSRSGSSHPDSMAYCALRSRSSTCRGSWRGGPKGSSRTGWSTRPRESYMIRRRTRHVHRSSFCCSRTSMGQWVQDPVSRGTCTPLIASIRLDFPADWFCAVSESALHHGERANVLNVHQ